MVRLRDIHEMMAMAVEQPPQEQHVMEPVRTDTHAEPAIDREGEFKILSVVAHVIEARSTARDYDYHCDDRPSRSCGQVRTGGSRHQGRAQYPPASQTVFMKVTLDRKHGR